MVNLQKRGIGENDLCPYYGKDLESIFHSIINYEVARRVWDIWEVQIAENWEGLYDISDVAMKILVKGTKRDLELFFRVAWSIWYNRNLVAFKSTCQLPSQIWSFAKMFLQEYRGTWVTLNTSPAAKNNRWTPPPPGVFKVNVDRATSEDGRNSSVGATIRDPCGAIIAACCKYLQGQFSIAKVEAIAVESGILLARDMKFPQVIIESDATSSINSINEKFTDGSLGHLYQGILALLTPSQVGKSNM